MSVEQKMRLHNKLYSYANKLLKKYNPCKIKNGRCIYGSICCKGCKYLTESGCSVRCLWCKLWLCNYLYREPEYRLLISKFDKIRRVAFRNNLLIVRGSEEDLKNKISNIEPKR